MRYFILILLIAILGCRKPLKDPITKSKSYWVNSSNHVVEIMPFANGIVRYEYKVALQPGEEFQIADHLSMGIIGFHIYFYSPYLTGNDSILVKFDDQYTISHYLYPPPQNLSLKYYLYTPPRNISNIASYEGKILSQSEESAVYEYIYRFTDQDYLDAK